MESIFFFGILVLWTSAGQLSEAQETESMNATSSAITTILKSSPSDVTTDSMTSSHVINLVSSSISSSHTSSYADTSSLETILNSVTTSQIAMVTTTGTFASPSATADVQVSPSVTPTRVSESVTSIHFSASVTSIQSSASVHVTSIRMAESVTSIQPGASVTSIQPGESVTSIQPGASVTSVETNASVTSVETDASVTSVQISTTLIIQSTSIAATPTRKITFSPSPSTTSVTTSTVDILRNSSTTSIPSPQTLSTTELIRPSTTVVSPPIVTTIQPSSVTLSTDSVTSSVLPRTPLPTTSPNIKPVIKKAPDHKVERKEGDPLVLDCEATGYPPPNIIWMKDGKKIPNPYTIEKTSRHDAGKYKCIATNVAGEDVMEFSVQIKYISAVSITFSKYPVKEGETVNITCSVESFPRSRFVWQFNGKEGILQAFQGPRKKTRDTSSVILTKVSRERHAGNYTCIGINRSAGIEAPASKMLEIDLSDPPTYPPPAKLHTTHSTIVVPVHNIEYLRNGKKVKYVQIIALELQKKHSPGEKTTSYTFSDIGPYEDGTSLPYIAAVFKINEKKEFVLGDGRSYEIPGRARRTVDGHHEYHNVPLHPDKYYTAFQRIVAADSDFNALPWIPPVKTKETPTEKHPRDNTVLIIGLVVGLVFILLISAIVVIGIYYKRHKSQSIRHGHKYETMNGMNPFGKMARTFSMHMARMNEHYHTPEPIPIEDFTHHVARMHKSGDMLFSTEYERIRDDCNIPATQCLDPANQWKNRYTNIVAYDHNRVKLIPFDDEPKSDYINASYIDGYDGITYIAAQGPLDETCGDFWRMIWEQNTRVIVMLTNIRERGRVKCTQYWPTSGSCKFEAAHISLDEEVQLTSHTIRVFRLMMANHDETRVIKQYHFTSWPDHGVPKSAAFLLAFVRETSKANPPDVGPMVVHCSAGVGRTGTFIVIDTMLRQIAKEKTIDVFHYVTQIRKQRNLMVQTEQQYIFIHDALLDAVISGDTEIHVSKLRQHIEEMLECDKEGETKLTSEFQKLSRGVRSHLPRSAANHSANKRKNRYANTLPIDETRVPLSAQVAVAGSDYINASYIDGYKKKRAFIATQAPLPQTFVDFWRMIWEQECYTIVTLAQEIENTKPKMDRYWPTAHPITYGNLEVEFLEDEKKELFDIRVFNIKNIQDEKIRTIHQYHYMDWTSEDIDDSGIHLLTMIDAIQQWQDASGNHVITVHCSAGVGRTGVFCAVTSLIERLKAEALVDVFMTVKLLREQRPAMVQTKIQYEYCYKVLLQYLGMNKPLEERDSPFDVMQRIITVKPRENEIEMNHVLPDHAQHNQTPEETEPESKKEEIQDDENNEDDDSEKELLHIGSPDSDPYISPSSSTFAVNT